MLGSGDIMMTKTMATNVLVPNESLTTYQVFIYTYSFLEIKKQHKVSRKRTRLAAKVLVSTSNFDICPSIYLPKKYLDNIHGMPGASWVLVNQILNSL